jgi:hypothetical protein
VKAALREHAKTLCTDKGYDHDFLDSVFAE